MLSSLTFTLQLYGSFFRKCSPEVEKCILWGSIQVLPNQVKKKSFHTFEDIDLRESHAKIHKNPSETLEADSIQRLEISIYCLPQSFNGFRLYFAQISFTKMKSLFIKLENESLPKGIGQELLIVNNSV